MNNHNPPLPLGLAPGPQPAPAPALASADGDDTSSPLFKGYRRGVLGVHLENEVQNE